MYIKSIDEDINENDEHKYKFEILSMGDIVDTYYYDDYEKAKHQFNNLYFNNNIGTHTYIDDKKIKVPEAYNYFNIKKRNPYDIKREMYKKLDEQDNQNKQNNKDKGDEN